MIRYIFILFFLCSYLCKAQGNLVTTKEQDVIEILKALEKQYGVFFSYDPSVLGRQPKRAISLKSTKLEDVLYDLFGTKFSYKRVGDYIAISLQKQNISQPTTLRTLSNDKNREAAQIDTVKIQKLIYVYDTQRVVLKEVIYDTIQINKIVYDTFKIKNESKENSWVSGISFFRWTNSSEDFHTSQIYTGLGVGISRELVLNRGTRFNFGILYSQQFRNIQIDYDSGNLSLEDTVMQKNSFSRINKVDLLRAHSSLSIQVVKINKNLSLDAEIGIGVYQVIKADEYLKLKNGAVVKNEARDYRKPFGNLILSMHLSIYKNESFYTRLTPFLEFGIHPIIDKNNISTKRSVAGVMMNFVF